MGYILAFEKLPASLTSLVIYDADGPSAEAQELIFDWIGLQILTLKVEPEDLAGNEFADYLEEFPNLLHLNALIDLIHDNAVNYLELQADHPLQSITLGISQFEEIFDPVIINSLEDLINIDRLPNIRRLLLNIYCLGDDWASFLRDDPLPEEHIKLLHISKRLRERSSSASGHKENGILLVDSDDDDAAVIEFTEENLARILSEAPPPRGTFTRRIVWN